MKILVPLKKAIDYNVPAQIAADGKSVITQGVKMSTNPFCDIALEEAIRCAEKNPDIQITALTIGDESQTDTLKRAMAMGAHSATLIRSDMTEHETLHKAKLLHAFLQKEPHDLVIMGKQSIDGDHNHIPQMLGALLEWNTGLFCSEIELDHSTVTVKREIDEGLAMNTLQIPCILSCDLRLNEPRFIPLPKILMAKNKPITIVEENTLDVAHTKQVERLTLSLPIPRKKGKITHDFDEFVSQLREILK